MAIAAAMSDKNALIQPDRDQAAIPIHLVDKNGFDEFVKGLSAPQRAALAAVDAPALVFIGGRDGHERVASR